jgi:acetoin utilization protein AcuB
MEIFKSNGKPMLPITDSGKVSAVVSESDMTHIVNKHCGVPVSRIMSRKPISASEDHSIFDVAKMLCRGPYRRLPIVNNGVVMGMVTPYDILSHLNRSESLNMLRFEHGSIKTVMNRNPVTIVEDADVSEAVAMMKVKKISGMPVVSEDADVVGMVTKRDIINAFR